MTTPTPTRLTARTSEDLLAMVPVVLGFQPADSVALLTFGAARPFHARIDLPASPTEDADIVQALLEPARHHEVARVAVVVYGAPSRATTVHRLGGPLVRAFQRAGIDVVDALWADGERWHPLLGRREGVPEEGVPYDVSSHRFTAQAVLDGRALLASRGELERVLDPDPDGTAVIASRLARPVRATGSAVAAAVARHLDAGRLPDGVLAAVLLGIRNPAVRDAAWVPVRRAVARDHVRLWTDAVRRAPAEVRGGAAAVLAMVAWISGDGALAWCAIDRCQQVDPDNSLARLVAEALQRAVPPDTLDELQEAGAVDPWW